MAGRGRVRGVDPLGAPVRFTPFEAGVSYMEFTEAVARSAKRGEAVDLPLAEFVVNE